MDDRQTESAGGGNKFEQLLRLADFRLERWKNRRLHEFGVSAAVWAFLAGALLTDKVRDALSFTQLAAVLILVCLGHFVWVCSSWSRNKRDIEWAFKYVGLAANGAAIPHPPPPATLIERLLRMDRCPKAKGWVQRHHLRFFLDEVPLFELGITVTLAVIVLLLAESRKGQPRSSRKSSENPSEPTSGMNNMSSYIRASRSCCTACATRVALTRS
jgi:hypothetical protein